MLSDFFCALFCGITCLHLPCSLLLDRSANAQGVTDHLDHTIQAVRPFDERTRESWRKLHKLVAAALLLALLLSWWSERGHSRQGSGASLAVVDEHIQAPACALDATLRQLATRLEAEAVAPDRNHAVDGLLTAVAAALSGRGSLSSCPVATHTRLRLRRSLGSHVELAATGGPPQQVLASAVGALLGYEKAVARTKAGINHLHHEKAAGETVCKLARHNGCRAAADLLDHCESRELSDTPLGSDPALPAPCAARPLHGLRRNLTFFGLEKSLPPAPHDRFAAELCDDFLNLVVLREPVSRAVSSCKQTVCIGELDGIDHRNYMNLTELPIAKCMQDQRQDNYATRTLLGFGGMIAKIGILDSDPDLVRAATTRLLETFDAVVTVDELGGLARPARAVPCTRPGPCLCFVPPQSAHDAMKRGSGRCGAQRHTLFGFHVRTSPQR